MIWCSIDCGIYTGITIWNRNGELIDCIALKDNGKLIEYYSEVARIKNDFNIVFALIEDYINMGKRWRNASSVKEQIRACKDVFDNRIMIYNRQWQKRSYSKREKQLIVKENYGLDVNDHQCDCTLMGREIFNFCEYRYGEGKGYEYLYKLATTTKKWPTKKDMIKKFQETINFKQKMIRK